jgi:ribosomal protein S12 methylthiotransferase accessory factor
LYFQSFGSSAPSDRTSDIAYDGIGMILFSLHGGLALRLPTDSQGPSRASSASEEKALQDLACLGFVRRMDGPGGARWRWSGDHPGDDRDLLALLARFDLHLEVGMAADEHVWIAAAVKQGTSSEPAGDAFSGTGFRPEDAVRSCLGEFAEFQSWLYRPGDSGRKCDRRALGESAINAWDVFGFAPEQNHYRLDFNRAWHGYDAIPEPTAFDGEVDWSPVKSLADGSTHWLPSQICFGRYAKDAWRSDSNGCAAGRTPDHAMAHALLELVERDATGIWWYGRIPRPAVPQPLLEGDSLAEALAKRMETGQRVWLLDLTHDLEIPVIAAILAGKDGTLQSLGFGCHVSQVQAARSAYLEMCQMELSVGFIRRRVAQAGDQAALDDLRLLDWMSPANAGRLAHLRPAQGLIPRRLPNTSNDEGHIAELVLERLQRARLEAYGVDLQRADVAVPAVRAFVPGLCHFKPRLGFRRLIEVPRALRWREAGFDTKDLSALPLLI